ncbi:MAG: diacylglycerol kinase family lipid kinase [Peptoniphilus grossensis]|uniref:diacylglycerol/lipid kinase family protein n=1 Tax=Peptoniphilus grossensis TaxID=1465756 RepID=UPI00258302E7|nr:diacylglycerol kinase family protein [Peptoniphilus grossensis]MDU5100183.1 diacylglycerol kinase family lipid kinase [Peptoniphilus grossensis]
MKKLFIISSKSGRSYDETLARELLKYFDEDEIKITEKAGDTVKFAQDFRDRGGEILYIKGGDGALSEVASVLAGSETALGLIPGGTGNDFSKNFSYHNFKLENIFDYEIAPIDLIEVNGKICINVTSLGFDTNVLKYAYDIMKRKKLGGRLGYFYGVVKSVMNLENVDLKISCLDEKNEEVNLSGSFLISALCNGSYYGNGFNPAPKAKIDDGLLNLILAEKMSPLRIASLFTFYRRGDHLGKSGVREILTRSGKISADREFLYNIDGEIYSDRNLKYRILEKKLKWIYFKGVKK